MPGALHNTCVLQHMGCPRVTWWVLALGRCGTGASRHWGARAAPRGARAAPRQVAAMPPGAPGGLCSCSDAGPRAQPGGAARTLPPGHSSTLGCWGVPGELSCWWPRHRGLRRAGRRGDLAPCAPCSIPTPCAPTTAQPPATASAAVTGKLSKTVSFPDSAPVPCPTERGAGGGHHAKPGARGVSDTDTARASQPPPKGFLSVFTEQRGCGARRAGGQRDAAAVPGLSRMLRSARRKPAPGDPGGSRGAAQLGPALGITHRPPGLGRPAGAGRREHGRRRRASPSPPG